ncbi:hypothetical protein B0H16DRAFT_1490252 [Mycena metata]|uniref:DUF6533 domain-containing protein n=1 Tax=Mycena metata TaxID=1033252 RepID=A0AAD7KJG7_9AGAR|nr:hypothetical protein B0H16DRAFT_1490252 [Mycena metata]
MPLVDPSAMAEELKALITALEDIQISRYVLLYDHLLTLPDEVEFVWPAKNTGPKVLFLVFRYMVPCFIVVNTTLFSGVSHLNMSTAVGWLGFSVYLGCFCILVSNFLVLLRIYTLIPRRHKLVAWTFCFWIVVQVASLAVATWTVVGMIPLIFSSNGSCVFSARPNVSGLWVVGLAFEVVIFGVICWNAARSRSTSNDSDVATMLFRDVLRVANTVIAVVAPLPLLFVGVFFIWAAATLTTSRLIINSRKTARLAILKAEVDWDYWKEFDSP